MSVKPVVKLPHNLLRAPTASVPLSDISGARIRQVIADMRDTLRAAADGVGLAAPQIGVGLKIFLVSEEARAVDNETANASNTAKVPKKWEYNVFINPVLKKKSREKRTMAEGCLSIPGKFGEISRADKVFLEWYDEHAKKRARGFSKFSARVIQHEMDHLDGVLIVDRAKKLMHVPREG